MSPDGRLLAYSANQRVDTDLDILVRDLVSGEVRTLLAADNRHFPLSWSPDSRHVLVLRLNQNTDHDLLLCAAATGECRRLTTRRPGDEARYLPGSWEPDGSGFYLATDEGRDTAGLAFFDLRQDRLRWLPSTDADSEAEVDSVTLSGDGRYLAWASSRDGASRLRALGRTVEYVVLDDEGHDIVKRHNRDRVARLTASWLEHHLLETSP